MSDNKKADVGSWDTDFPADKEKTNNDYNEKRLPFMKFEKPGDYTIRLVGNHVKFHRHWAPFKNRVISHIDYKDEDPAWQAGFYPRETFAIHIIDRQDGELKILEKGRSLFKQFARYKIVNDVNPAGKEGPDWVITVEWPNGNKRQAKYSATAKAKPSPFTEEEIEMIKENKVPLKDIYQTTPLEKIQELWDEIPEEAKVKESPLESDSPKVKEEIPQSSNNLEESLETANVESNNDNLFDDDDDDSF